jgi:hypothetical protein
MGKWTEYDGDATHGEGTYLDSAGVHWHVWGAGKVLGRGGWSATPVEYPNRYHLPNNTTAYSGEDSREAILERLDDAAYVWRQTNPEGDLYANAQAARGIGDNKFGAVLLVVALLFLASKGNRR